MSSLRMLAVPSVMAPRTLQVLMLFFHYYIESFKEQCLTLAYKSLAGI